jgi:hypothetical protein
MQRCSSAVLVISLLSVAGCSRETVVHDFSTPQGAILCLEDAYRAKDLEAAVKCKDFRLEARLMLEKLGTPKEELDEMVKLTADVLELGFRKELQEDGFPDFHGVTSHFPHTEPAGDNVVTVTEECAHASGQKSTNKLLVGKSSDGWRVLNPVE